MKIDIKKSYAFGDGKPLSEAENGKVCNKTKKYHYIEEDSVIEENGIKRQVIIEIQVYTLIALQRRFLRFVQSNSESESFLDILQCAQVNRVGNKYYFNGREVINSYERSSPNLHNGDANIYILPLHILFQSFFKKGPIQYNSINTGIIKLENPALFNSLLISRPPESASEDSQTNLAYLNSQDSLCEAVTSNVNTSIFSDILNKTSNSNCQALISRVEDSVFCGNETRSTQFLECKPSEVCCSLPIRENKIHGFFDKRTLESPNLPPSKRINYNLDSDFDFDFDDNDNYGFNGSFG